MIVFELKEGVERPKYETEGASGMDVVANSIIMSFKGDKKNSDEKILKMQEGFNERGSIKIRPFERILFGTGIRVADMDHRFEIQVRPRSGQSLKKGIMVANSPGTIDSDYRGEIGIIIYNASPFLTTIEKGERIAQLVVSRIDKVPVSVLGVDSNKATESNRGSLGFGSTGTKSSDQI